MVGRRVNKAVADYNILISIRSKSSIQSFRAGPKGEPLTTNSNN